MPVYALGDSSPELDDSVFVAPTAVVVGNVSLGEQASVWFGAAIRGDNAKITVGARSNVQENAVLHVDDGYPLTIGPDVTIGHQAMLHGCTIGAGSLIGIQAVVLNGAKIGKGCLIGAGALVTEGTEIPDGSLVLGTPAKVVKTLSDAQIARFQLGTASYALKAKEYQEQLTEI